MQTETLVVDMRSNVPQEALKAAAAMAKFDSAVAGAAGRVASASRTIDAGMRSVSESTARSRLNLAAFAGTLDDLQYVGEMGIRPIINNVAQIAPALGIALIAADQLFKNWSKLTDALGFVSPIQSARDELARLEAQTRRTADEEERYLRLKERAELSDKLAASEGRPIAAMRGAAGKLLEDDRGLYDAAVAASFRQRNPNGIELTDEDRRRARALATSAPVAGGPGGGAPATPIFDADRYRAELQRIAGERHRAEEQAARDEVAGATESPEKLRALIGSMRRFGAATEYDLGRLEATTPEGQQEAQQKKVRDALGEFWSKLAEAVDEKTRKMAEQARDEEGRLLDEDLERGNAEHRRNRLENERKAADVAKQLLGGDGGLSDALIGGTATEEQVAEAMRRAGFGEETIGRRAGQVLASAAEQAEEQVRQRALGGNLTTDQARQAILGERQAGRQAQALRNRRELMAEAMADRRAVRPSQVIDIANFANTIQSAVGGHDPMREMIQRTDRQIDLLQRIERELRDANRL